MKTKDIKSLFEKLRTTKVKQTLIRVTSLQFILQKKESYLQDGLKQNESTISRI